MKDSANLKQYVDGQISDAKQQLQKVLTSLFAAERMLREYGGQLDQIRAIRIYETRKQLANIAHSELGETPCIPPHNQLPIKSS